MNDLTPAGKLKLIRDLVEKHDISAYEIGEKTELNASGIHRILTGEVKKPREKTLSIILEYIENKIVGTQYKNISEPKNEYFKPPSIENQLAERVFEMMMPELREMKKEILKAILNLDIEVSELRNVQEELLRVQKEIEKSCNNSVRILEEKL